MVNHNYLFVEWSDDKSGMLATSFKIGQRNLNTIQLVNVTKLQFGNCYRRATHHGSKFTALDKVRAKIFARLISMPVQLKYLSLENFQWLLYVIENAFDDLRENVLSTVQHAEFGIPSCNLGNYESIYVGKHLVPFLNGYMPHLQTLCLWRPDDFPWTSIRSNLKAGRYNSLLTRRWLQYLRTPQSINEHVTVFEQDLCQLFEGLKQFVFLNIYGTIPVEKFEPYRLMTQCRFPNSQFDIQISRFRLWI
ncbi:unnamed protein product [Rotaria sp. Silwood1]|nr:unnamed protein product [Rotaria sp. Silwood1]